MVQTGNGSAPLVSGQQPARPAPTEEDRDLIRQGERTVDNLKRLFAVVFAISFGVLGQNVIERLRPIFSDAHATVPPLAIWMIYGGMIGVFCITAGVFYHQSVKFLDVRYAKAPLTEAHPFGFAFDYAILVLTAAPFFLMAHSLNRLVTARVGFTLFFVSYMILIGSGLSLLILGDIRHLSVVRRVLLRETFPDEELERQWIISRYWLVMNSFFFLLLMCLFAASTDWEPCPTAGRGNNISWFMYVFGVVTISRDLLDYRYAWRFLYPVRASRAAGLDLWPLTRLVRSPNPQRWSIAGYVMIAAAFSVALSIRVGDVSGWVQRCQLH
jgi:hypothetical protein